MDFYSLLYNKVTNFLTSPDVNVPLNVQDRELTVELYRILRYRRYWNAWHNFQYMRRKPQSSSPLQINIARAVIDRSVDFLLGNPYTPSASKEVSRVISPVLKYVREQGRTDLSSLEAGITGSVCGDAIIKVIWDEKIQSPRWQILDSEKCFLDYSSYDKSRTQLDRAIIVWEGYYDWNGTRPKKWVLYKEEWTNDTLKKGIEYLRDDSTNNNRGSNLFRSFFSFGRVNQKDLTIADFATEVISETKNDLGYIPLVHIRNQILPFDNYGRSDLADVSALWLSINESINKYIDAVNYHGDPITLVYGAKVGNLRKGANKIWSGLPKDSKVENLGGESDFPALKELNSVLMDYVYFTGSMPEVSTGLYQHISNATGVALQVQYLPLIGMTKRKRLTYGPGFGSCFEISLKFMDKYLKLNLNKAISEYKDVVEEQIDAASTKLSEEDADKQKFQDQLKDILKSVKDKMPKPNYFAVDIQFAEFLPKDETILLQNIQVERDLGLESKRGSMVQYGVEDPDEKMEEIRLEKQTEVSSVSAPTKDETGKGGIFEGAGNGKGKPPGEAGKENLGQSPQVEIQKEAK